VDKTAIVYHEGIAEYDFGEDYSLRGDRFPRYLRLLENEGILKRPDLELIKPEAANNKDLELVHTKEYIERVNEIAEKEGYLSDDTPIKPSIVKAVKLIVGAALKAGELVAQKKVKIAQGVGGGLHHSGRDYGEGWCVFNDVAICAEAMIERHKKRRVLILDTDAHAGNGTMDIFYEDPKILYITLHQDPMTLYPNTGFIEQIGRNEGEGYTINVPLPKKADDECYNLVLKSVFRPIARQFKPEVIIRNGGADPHYLDELAELGLTYRGLWSLGRSASEAADEMGCGLVDLLCGGYNPGHEEWGLYALLLGELNQELKFHEEGHSPKKNTKTLEKTEEILKKLRNSISGYWSI
jgi:acetoin utilization protein AcuC